MLTDIDPKAVALGTLVYVLAIGLVTGLLTLTANVTPGAFENLAFRSVYWIVGVLMVSGGGFVAGYLAGRHGVLHGVVVAIAGALLVVGGLAIVMPEAADQGTFSGYLTTGLVLSGLAGGNGELLALKRGR